MPKIIYKQQHVGENGRRYSASRNSHFVRYIGERIHVLPTSHGTRLVQYMGEREHAARLESPNGLFGFMAGKFSDNLSTSEMQSYVRKISTPNRNIFHSIFSFTPDSADEAGLKSLSDWEEWLKYHMSEAASCMNMKIENIEYLAAVHLKENQPHIHVMWWDKSQQVFINKVDPLVCDKIRVAVIKSTYHDTFVKLHNTEDKLIKDLRESISRNTEKIISEQQAGDFARTVSAALDSIYCKIPQTGRITYKFMPPEIKAELNKLTHFIIDNVPEYRRLFDEICDCRRLYNEMLHSSDSNYGKLQMVSYMGKIKDDIEASAGNAILRIVKREKEAGTKKLSDVLDTGVFPEPPKTDMPDEPTNTESTAIRLRWSKAYKEARQILYEENNPQKALPLYCAKAKRGNVLAMHDIGLMYRRGLLGAENTSKADFYFKAALDGFIRLEANGGKMQAYLQYRIAKMYERGYGTEQSFEQAFAWFERAADAENEFAQFSLAGMYKYGSGIEQDLNKAFEWYSKSADKGNAYACYETAQMLKLGNVTPVDAAKAEQYFKQAYNGFIALIRKGSSDDNLFYKLGYMTYKGIGCTTDKLTAAEYLKKAVMLKNAHAMYMYGRILVEGDEFPQDIDEGLKLITYAADSIDTAKCYLGRLYAKGDHVAKDVTRGIELLKECGSDPLVNYTLGAIYMFEPEVKNRELAMKYLSLSAQAGNEYAQDLIDNAEYHVHRNIMGLLGSIMKILAYNQQNSEASLSAAATKIFGRGDLSREQLNELLLKIQDKENTAEM